MEKITKGNLNEQEDSEKRGWFIGNFITKNKNFKSNDFEVRWGNHFKGEKKQGIVANKSAKTLSILISGKFLLKFPKNNKEIVLSKVGDYSFWDSGIYHSSEALEDSIVLTIRWPSVSDDTIKIYKKSH
jgi:hypothetical protein